MERKVFERQNIDYKEIVLRTLLIGGLVAVAVVAPNAIQALSMFMKKDERSEYYARRYIERKVVALARTGFITFTQKNGKRFVTLTPKGKKEVEKYLLGDLAIKKPKKWDLKWRIVSFDVKNTRTPLRNLLRHHLRRLGFVQYQKSIWVHPYECEDVVIMLKSYFKFGKEVMYIVAEHIENDTALRRGFTLN